MIEQDESAKTLESRGCTAMDNLIKICEEGMVVQTAKGEMNTVTASAGHYSALHRWLREKKEICIALGVQEKEVEEKPDELAQSLMRMKRPAGSRAQSAATRPRKAKPVPEPVNGE